MSQAPGTEQRKHAIDPYVNEVAFSVCGGAHPALQDAPCGPIPGPRLQALVSEVEGGPGPAWGGEMFVAPKGT